MSSFDPNSKDMETKLRQSALVLKEKINVLNELDEAILDLVEEKNIDQEIKESDIFKEGMQRSIVNI